MSQLKELFEKRDTEHLKITQVLLKTLQPATDCIMEFIGAHSQQDPSIGTFSWDDVLFLNNESNPLVKEIIVFMGSVSYKIGAKLTMPDGSVVEITEETAEYFKRIIRIGIPLDLAEKGDKKKITEFLRDVSMTESEPEPPSTIDFDLDTLTEAQRMAVLAYSQDGGGTKH